MKADLYYFNDCPSFRKALANLQQALRDERLPDDVELVAVEDAADAEAKRFIGSPTVRLDGIDIEGPQAEAQGYGFGCRLYTNGGQMVGWPSVDQIRRAVRRRRHEHGEGRL
jgi:hypothetical protein